VSWHSKTGELVKSEQSVVTYNPLLPGQTSPFRVMVSNNPAMATASIAFRTARAGQLPTKYPAPSGKKK
jgi:hypothetical protein